jgi:hypothetical protein
MLIRRSRRISINNTSHFDLNRKFLEAMGLIDNKYDQHTLPKVKTWQIDFFDHDFPQE